MLRTLVLVAGLGLVPKVIASAPVAVTLTAADGVTVYGESYVASSPTAPVVLLFHQAESSRNEYAPIAPRLVESGYNALAIDQRSGGDLYAPGNETVKRLGKSAPYLSVLADMEGALAWAKRTYPQSRIVLWGSSYSASLVFALAAKHPHDVAAVVAFSPAEYFPDKHYVRNAAKNVHVPVFIDSAADAAEERAARDILAAVTSDVKTAYVPKSGIHGSSTLRDDRDPAGAAENWEAVSAFLTRVTSARH